MDKKVVVTGCSGFIGYHLSNTLLDDDNTVIGIGSVVNKNCKKNSIYWGSPAKKIRLRKNNENYLNFR